MFDISTLPLRQKIFIGLTVFGGLFLMLCSLFGLLQQDTLNTLIFFYGFTTPLLLLTFDTIIDLNDRNIFTIWLTIAILLFVVSLFTYNSDDYLIERSSKFDKTSGVNSLIGEHSTSSLKALFIFLIFYWLLNRFLNRNGLFIVNTFRQRNWYHEVAKREITGLDVIINIFLYATVLAAGLFGH